MPAHAHQNASRQHQSSSRERATTSPSPVQAQYVSPRSGLLAMAELARRLAPAPPPSDRLAPAGTGIALPGTGKPLVPASNSSRLYVLRLLGVRKSSSPPSSSTSAVL